jgi:hypothetical protein
MLLNSNGFKGRTVWLAMLPARVVSLKIRIIGCAIILTSTYG